ncbi:MAG TPA: RlmE family RNA methyltransferase [Alphaproteobacteria bacterium]
MAGEGPGRGGKRRRGAAARTPTVRVKTAKGRKTSSTRWLQRQLNDPYVVRAKAEGYRSRAAYKLIEIDDRFRILAKGRRVLDLGAAPGGWTQVAVARVGAGKPGGGAVVALDSVPMRPIAGATLLRLDFLGEAAPAALAEAAGGPIDVVLSDLAPAATGVARIDHLRIMALCEAVIDFAMGVLAPGGALVTKVWRGGGEAALVARLKRAFATVRHVKPPASRPESAELYLVAIGFRGAGPEAGGTPPPRPARA